MSDIRFTKPTMLVLEALVTAAPDTPPWGLSICEHADLGSGTVYPILERLRTAGWVRTWEEESAHPGRPPRLYYEITSAGRAAYSEAVAAKAARRGKRLPGAKGIVLQALRSIRLGGAT